MPFCPKCRSEFREGFKTCNTCHGTPLVAELPPERGAALDLDEAEVEDALPIGFARGGASLVEVDGRKVDPSRVFSLSVAAQVRALLAQAGIASAIVATDVEMADQVARYEVRVRAADQERAEKFLFDRWKATFADDEELEAADEVSIDQCPACGSNVPLDVEECPDCGLVVGTGDERAAAAEE